MLQKLDSIKKQLSELATVLNAFKSEAVQLRILDFVLGEKSSKESDEKLASTHTSLKTRTRSIATPRKEKSTTSATRKKAIVGTGASATLNQLLAGTFFDKSRTINDIINHCKNKMARKFKANDFSSKLGHMVRNDELSREKNADNQYEYKKP
jgi:hypothetical protein